MKQKKNNCDSSSLLALNILTAVNSVLHAVCWQISKLIKLINQSVGQSASSSVHPSVHHSNKKQSAVYRRWVAAVSRRLTRPWPDPVPVWYHHAVYSAARTDHDFHSAASPAMPGNFSIQLSQWSRVEKLGKGGRKLQSFDRQLQVPNPADYGCSKFQFCPLIPPKMRNK